MVLLQMKKFGIKPTDPTYTAIFNSFSNSPNKEDALERAIKLRELMKEKEISVNVISHQAMIKVFNILLWLHLLYFLYV